MLGMMMMMMLGEQLDCCIPKRSTRGEGLESFCGSGLWWPEPCHGLAVAAFAFDVSVMEKKRFLKALAMQGRVTPRDGAAVQRCLLKAPWRKFKLSQGRASPFGCLSPLPGLSSTGPWITPSFT